MCDCLWKIFQELEANPKYIEPRFENTVNHWSLNSGREQRRAGSLDFSYHFPLKNGQPSKGRIKGKIVFKYCPFCGEEYSDISKFEGEE